MATPRLNGRVYAELYQSARDRNPATGNRQKQTVTATLPVIESLIQLKAVKFKLRASIKALDAKKTKSNDVEESKEALKNAYSDLKPISSKLNTTLTTLNITFTENMRKRQLDALGALGPMFKYEKAQSSEELLFDGKTMAHIKPLLKEKRRKEE